MEGIGAEVSQKIRSAIKAKLMELGAYIDDELPDYVMVMVANKRSRSQMNDDLQLFLGTHTISFTSWLHQVLQKLQEVTVTNLGGSDKKRNLSDKVASKRKLSENDSKVSKKHASSAQQLDGIIQKEKEENATPSQRHSPEKETDAKLCDVLVVSPPKTKTKETKESRKSDANSVEERKSETPCGSETKLLTDGLLKLSVDSNLSKRSEKSEVGETNSLPPLDSESADGDVSPKEKLSLTQKGRLPSIEGEDDDDDFINIKADVDVEGFSDGETNKLDVTELKPSVLIEKKDKDDTHDKGSVRVASTASVVSVVEKKENASDRFERRPVFDARELLNRKRKASQQQYSPTKTVLLSKTEPYVPSARRNVIRPYEREPLCRKFQTGAEERLCTARHQNARKDSPEDRRNKDIVKRNDDDRDREERTTRERPKLDRRVTSLGQSVSQRETRIGRGRNVISISETLKAERDMQWPRKKEEPQDEKPNVNKLRKGGGVQSRVVAREVSPESQLDQPVSSLVKVTPRPKRALQANCNLILKAVAEAQKSIATAPPRNHRTQREAKEEAREKRKHESSQPKNIAITVSNEKPLPTEDSDVSDAPISLDVKVKGSTQELDASSPSDISLGTSCCSFRLQSTSDPDESADAGKIAAVGEWLKGVKETESIKPELESFREQPTQTDATKLEPTPQFVVTLDGLDLDMFDDGEDWEKDGQGQEEQVWEDRKGEEVERQQEEEGWAEDREWAEEKQYEEGSQDNNSDTQAPPQADAPTITKKKKVATPIVIVNSDNSDDGSNDALSIKTLTRCKYYPACRAKENCIFLHPKIPCKLFPNCKFGNQCVYSHPACKFGTLCTRRDCPFMHLQSAGAISALKPTAVMTKPKPLLPLSVPASQQCRFYPNCTNTNCLFYHPKNCKFGSYCFKKDCTFIHVTAPPRKEKLKWLRDQSS